MKKIGILYGMEHAFPQDLVNRINELKPSGIKAEFIQTGAIKMDDIIDYHVILDRVSHDVPFFRSMLKLAVLNGVHVVNNPFWICTDNHFFHASLATKMDIKVPKTVILPSKEHPEGTTGDAMRNLIFPLNWDDVFEYVGFPAYIKPNVDSPNLTSYKVYNPGEFFAAYDLTGKRTMILQESIEYTEYYLCYVIGKKHVKIMRYDPVKPQHLRYIVDGTKIDDAMAEKIKEICIKICEALGFDFNAIEFAVRDEIPYAIDFMNPAPSAVAEYLHEDNYEWLLQTSSEYLIELAEIRKNQPGAYNWCKFLSSEEAKPARKRRTIKIVKE